MTLSNAERKRLFRDRLKNDPDRRGQFQEKGRQRWHDRKIFGKVNPFATELFFGFDGI